MLDFIFALVALRYFPSLLVFAPLLVKNYFSKDLISSLYMALFTGAIMDLFSTESTFGMTSLNYVIVTLLIHRLKWHINPHKLYSIPIYTLIFSLISTFFSLLQVSREFFLPCLLDAAYAFIWFSCPPFIYDQFQKQMGKISPWLKSLKF
ncbi:MAG: hypothetical protein KBC64_05320 [Simkaniaceae bacterium]|nr:hypothetical protein [Simkaniaceae bacterium]